MKCLIQTVCAVLLLIPTVALAGWQITSPQEAVPNDPFFQAGLNQNRHNPPSGNCNAFPNQFDMNNRPKQVYAISLCGSVKENLEHIMHRYHWRVVWKAPYDFNFDGRVTGSSLPDVIEKVLKPFPLQAKMYMSNRTMEVIARN